MATILAAQALFLAKLMVPYTVGLGFSTVLSEHYSVPYYIYMHIQRLIIKSKGQFANVLQLVIVFNAKFPTVIIH